ncbi:tyrosine phosphatase family-domain-containing protein [Xylariaceae sp. FL0016]|nr:tyrosine phosphatase family-domain-containing protein [Xylariaceae sp. FL0016]
MAASQENTLPSPPFLAVPGLPNFRDAGGYPLSGPSGSDVNKVVRRNIIYRASEPSRLSPEGVAQLQALKIAHVYDLRSAVEIERGQREGHGWHIKEWEGATRHFVPVFLDQDYSPEALASRYANYAAESEEGFIKAYTDILENASASTNASAPFRTILSHLASATAPPSPVLIHCTAGKDRTGVIVALILSLCGASDDVVAHEYSLTELGLQSRIDEFVSHLMNNPALAGNKAGARRMVGARKAAMLGTLSRFREKYGSIEQCVVDNGLLSPESIAQLRKNLVVDAKDEKAIAWEEHAKMQF